MTFEGPAWDATVGDAELCFVDLEMTSLDPEAGQICEVCLVRTKGSVETSTLTSLVRADRGVGASRSFHGIDDDMLRSAPSFAELAPEVERLLSGAILVGHAVSHDADFLKAELARVGRPMRTVGEIDTLVLARRVFGFRSNKLGALAAELGIPMARAHRAEDDARATVALFARLVAALAPKSMRDLAHVHVGDRQPRPEVLSRCVAAIGGPPLPIRYRRSSRAAQDLSFCVTAVSTDDTVPKVHGYTMPERARRTLFAHRIVAVDMLPTTFEDGGSKDVSLARAAPLPSGGMRLRPLVPLALLSLSACSSPPPPAKVAPPAASSAVVAAPPPPQAPDLSPATEPAGLVGTIRWRGPLSEIDAMLRIAKAGVTVSDLAKKEGKGEGLELIKQDASFDVAVALDGSSTIDDPRWVFAVSIPLNSIEDTLAADRKKGHAIEQVRPGVHRVTKDDPCDISVAVDVPGRMVCSTSVRALEMLRPYLTRTLVTTPAEPGLKASMRMKPFRDRFLPDLRQEAAKLEDELVQKLKREGVSDPELLGVLAAVLDDSFKLADDLDRVEVTHQLDEAKRSLTASGSIVFGSTHSWMAQYVLSPGKHAGPVPPAFFKLPKDAMTASFSHGPDPQLTDGPTRVLRKIVTEITARAKLDPADADAVQRIVAAWPPSANVSVFAQGVPRTKLPKLSAKPTPAEIDRHGKEMVARFAGWSLAGVDVPVDAYGTLFKRLRDGYQRGLAFANKKAKTPTERKDLAKAPAVRVVESPAGYPKGSIALDLVVKYPNELNDELIQKRTKGTSVKPTAVPVAASKVPPPTTFPKPTPKRTGTTEITARLVATPDGSTTWLAFSLDPAALGQLVTATVKAAPDDTLAGVKDIDGLKRDGLTSGGFFRFPTDLMDEVFDAAEGTAGGDDAKDVAAIHALLTTIPNKGRTPLLFFGTTKTTLPASLSVGVQVQPGTIDDAAAIGAYFLGPGRKMLKKRAVP